MATFSKSPLKSFDQGPCLPKFLLLGPFIVVVEKIKKIRSFQKVGWELYNGHETPVWEPQDIKYNVSGSSPFRAHFKDVQVEKEKVEKNWLVAIIIFSSSSWKIPLSVYEFVSFENIATVKTSHFFNHSNFFGRFC